MLIKSDPSSPIYLVSPDGDYVRDSAGKPRIFEGEAVETHSSGYLVDSAGNFLLSNNAYIPVPHANTQTVASSIRQKTLEDVTVRSLNVAPSTIAPSAPARPAPTAHAPVYPPAQYAPIRTRQAAPPTQSHSDDTDSKSGTRWALILLGVLLALALGVGGAFFAAGAFDDSDVTATDNDGKSHRKSDKTPDDDETDRISLPSEAYQGAGTSDIPADATHADDVIMSPTKNLHCDLSSKRSLECRADNWAEDKPYGDDSYGLSLTPTGTAELAPSNVSGGTEVPYGTVVYNDNWVCASEQNGMTCWSTESGHGFFINRAGYQGF